MLTSKQRSTLKGLAMNLDPIFQIGKNGVTDIQVEELSKALEARELIKISVLQNSEMNARELADSVALSLRAEAVCAIGNKIILYRRSHKKDIEHISLKR